MIRYSSLAALAPIASIVLMVPAQAASQTAPVAAVDRTTPEKTVQSFIDAVVRGDISAIVECVDGATLSPTTKKFEAMMKQSPWPYGAMDLTDFASKDGENGAVRLTFTLKSKGDGKEQLPKDVPNPETLTLHKDGDLWKIVPLSKEAVAKFGESGPQGAPEGAGILGLVTGIVRYPEILGQQEFTPAEPGKAAPAGQAAPSGRAAAPPTSSASMSNVKQICLGLLMLLQDYDEKFAVKAATYKKSVLPYIKNEKVFTSPLDKPGTLSYQFNPKLAGVAMAKIKSPATTVMVYEGAWSKPSFRNGGKALIGFVDGHVKLVTPTEAKSLRWTP